MKISPIAAGAPKTVNVNEGSSASPERLARAKQISMGQQPTGQTDPGTGDLQADRAQASIKKIKMRTNRNTTRYEAPAEAVQETLTKTESDIPNSNEQAVETSEENKPLSPQFAALAKQRRAVQLKEQELLAREKALETSSGNTKSLEEYKARIKANALSVLKEEGVTYDQLTEQILADTGDNQDLEAIRAEMRALKEELKKESADKETATEQQALAQIRREAEQLVAQGDDFEMVREAGYAPKVVELIHKTFKATGEVMDTAEAATLIENELLEESLKFARLKKVQSSLNPAPTQKSPPVQTDRPNVKIMRTLTNRDGVSSSTMTKRERAIAAMEGRLK